jgi:hypothetical protein
MRKVDGGIGIGREKDPTGTEIGTESIVTGTENVKKENERRIGIGIKKRIVTDPTETETETVNVTDIIAGGMRTLLIGQGISTSRGEGMSMMMNIVVQGDLDATETGSEMGTGTEKDTRSRKGRRTGGKKDIGRRPTLRRRLQIRVDRNSRKCSRRLSMLVARCRLKLKLPGTWVLGDLWGWPCVVLACLGIIFFCFFVFVAIYSDSLEVHCIL